ncbi:MAG TPA: hypothetical protein VFD94_12355 [Jatrophihabitans sp.]|nr:hypothetical protein [Jatrophihabitans sp.]
MNIWMKRCLETGVIVGGLWVLGSGLASAQDLGQGAGSTAQHGHGVLSAPVTAPITVSGNAVSLLGHSHATTTTGQPATAPAGRHAAISVPVTAPITVSGNAVAVLGRSHATSGGSSSGGSSSGSSNSGSSTSGSDTPARHRSLVSAPVTAPVTVCGNAVGRASAGCTVAGPTGSTAGSGSVLDVPVTAPVTACGNGVGLLGNASASCTTPAGPGSGSGSTTGSSSGGVDVPVSVPVTVCGNGVGLLGSASAGCGGTPPVTGGGNPPVTGGSAGTGTSTQAVDSSSAVRAQDKSALRLVARPGQLAFTGSGLALLEWLAVALLAAGCVLTFGWRRHTR